MSQPLFMAYTTPVLLLIASNVFMTIAWYWHLKFHDKSLISVVLISWGIAFVEYCIAVPANRWGYGTYSPYELKTIQEVVTLAVFVVFSWSYLGAPPSLNTVIGFALIVAGAWFVFQK